MTTSISRTPDSRFTDENIAAVDRSALVAYMQEAEFAAYTARDTDKVAWEDALDRLTAELLRRRRADRSAV